MQDDCQVARGTTVLPRPEVAHPLLLMPTATPPRDLQPASTRWLGRVLAALGLLVIGALIAKAGPSNVLHAIERVGWSFVPIVLAPIVGMVLHGWGWLVLLPRAARPTAKAALWAQVAAQAGDELGAGVAGEPLKLAATNRAFRSRALVALAVDNVAQVIAVGVFLLTASCALRMQYPDLRSSALGLMAVAGALLVSVGIALPMLMAGAIQRSRLRTYAWGARLLHTLNTTRMFMRRRPRKVLGSVLLHGLGKAWIVPEMALALTLLGASSSASLWLAPMSVLGSLLGTMIPGQAGAVEVALALGGTLAGVDPPTVMALALLRRLRTGFWIVVGGVLVRRVIKEGESPERSSRIAP